MSPTRRIEYFPVPGREAAIYDPLLPTGIQGAHDKASDYTAYVFLGEKQTGVENPLNYPPSKYITIKVTFFLIAYDIPRGACVFGHPPTFCGRNRMGGFLPDGTW